MKMQTLLILIGAGVALWGGWGVYISATTEEPPYKVLEQFEEKVEIRQYEEQTWISTRSGERNAAFGVLASYIFGQNEKQESIAMTAPVIMDDNMSFILPEGYSEANVPAPDGQAMDFKTVPARKVATIRFSGWATARRVADHTEKLMVVLEDNGVETDGEPFLMQYNPPMTLPMMRRNEVGIALP
ncbi:MAG: heme-binding protein [Bacteroidota bacterium]